MMKTTKLLFAIPFTALLALGCSANVDGNSVDDTAETKLAVTSCGSQYAEAFTYYKAAVDASKDRLRDGVCESDAFLWDIADNASRAVMTCGAFRDVIRTSPWAAPLREVLSESLTYRSLTGELLVIRDSHWQNWTNVETFFDSSLTFWARPEGAYGSSVQIDFASNGVASWGEHIYNEVTGEVGWHTVPAEYTVTKVVGFESRARQVYVTHEGQTDVFSLGVENPRGWKDAPVFVLSPVDASSGEQLEEGEATSPKLYSLVYECDA